MCCAVDMLTYYAIFVLCYEHHNCELLLSHARLVLQRTTCREVDDATCKLELPERKAHSQIICDITVLTCYRTTQSSPETFSTAIMADAPLPLLFGQHKLVGTTVVVHWLVVEKTVPSDVLGECRVCGARGLRMNSCIGLDSTQTNTGWIAWYIC